MFEIDCYNEAIDLRNDCWKSNPNIPNWVNIENVGLDQFFTHPDIAILYYNQLLEFLSKEGIEIDNCIFIEPSAGAGSFFDLLPKSRSIGLDIYPIKNSIDQQDFLSWELPEKYEKKIKIFIGNPPFGYRGWLALSFMNHAAKYADYVGFILPMSFQSDGKGSPKNRVRGLRLKHSEIVPKNCFVSPLGKVEKVNALWQIWKQGENLKKSRPTCKQWIDIFTIDLRKERLCGMEKMDDADFFLQRTFYSRPPKLVKDFSEVKYVCGYGLILKKEKNHLTRILNSTDWTSYSNLAAHNCCHISMYHIEKVLTDSKIVDAGL